MAEEMGGFEGFGGAPGGAEKAGESDEKFRERFAQSQAAVQQIRKEEQRKKQDDNLLAILIVQFLGEPAYTRFFLLISRLVAKNLPSDLIIAIIALIYKPARDHIEQKFGAEGFNIKLPEKMDFSTAAKAEINTWLRGISNVATSEPQKILATGLDGEGKIDGSLVQLSIFCLQEFLEKQNDAEVNFENIRSFLEAFWKNLFTQIAEQIENQPLLTE